MPVLSNAEGIEDGDLRSSILDPQLPTNRFTRALNTSEGSLGQLINNPELYKNLNQAILNINCLTRELQPVVRDARVLTDKLARHPGAIVTDAVSPGPGIK